MSDPAPLEGAGVFSSAADVAQALHSGDAAGIGWTTVGYALDVADFVGDPFVEAASAGFGWLIEHVWFLREALDQLAGDPQAIITAADGWLATGAALATEGATLGTPELSWSGWASNASAAAEAELAARMEDAVAECTGVAQELVSAGVAVGTVRALVRDAIADFLASVLEWLLVTMLSAGVALAALLVSVVKEAIVLAGRLVTRLGELLTRLGAATARLGTRAGRLGTGLRPVATSVEQAATGAARLGDAGRRAAADLRRSAGAPEPAVTSTPGRDAVVEWGKQESAARTRDTPRLGSP